LGGVLLSIGGLSWLGTRQGSAVSLPLEGLKTLSPEQYALVESLADRMIPVMKGQPRPRQLQIAQRIDGLLSLADPSAQAELKQLLGLFQNALVAFVFIGFSGGFGRPFTELSPDAQDRVLRSWEFSALSLRRTGFQAVRALVVAAYYGSRETWSALDYPGQARP
jgi:hypothetical protein